MHEQEAGRNVGSAFLVPYLPVAFALALVAGCSPTLRVSRVPDGLIIEQTIHEYHYVFVDWPDKSYLHIRNGSDQGRRYVCYYLGGWAEWEPSQKGRFWYHVHCDGVHLSIATNDAQWIHTGTYTLSDLDPVPDPSGIYRVMLDHEMMTGPASSTRATPAAP